ncbi:hypothetical protein [Krasilnikovia sp. MM14-A1004]|uniref:hypothetical protein n=1 Tax=Krasilnikovia sp. MM14-A1004 TaxID=3373541 RepID=UPI00399CCFBF
MRVRIASTLAVVAATIGLAATAAGPIIAAFDDKPSSHSTQSVEAGTRGRIMRETPPPTTAAATPTAAATTTSAKGKSGK